MRKPRDYDAELKALNDRAKQLKERKVGQLGDLVIATGADALTIEHLAGLLLTGMEKKDAAVKEGWRKRGAAFFQRGQDSDAGSDRRVQGRAAQSDGGTQSPAAATRQN